LAAKPSAPPFEAVLFDLDDTLHDDTATYRRAAERVALDVARTHGVAASAVLAAYVRQADAFWINLAPEQLGTPLVGLRLSLWTAALHETGLEDATLAQLCARSYNDYRREYLQLWPGVLELLAALRKRGSKLALVTNGFAETHREKIVLLGLESAFDEVFIADEVGMLKPDPRLFRLACQRLGAKPEQSAMVGDRYERDIRGAHETGMFTVWVNVRGERVPPGGPQPDAVVADVGGVLDALESRLSPGRNG
jgi:putative hydrolase of the HAD superfamily